MGKKRRCYTTEWRSDSLFWEPAEAVVYFLIPPVTFQVSCFVGVVKGKASLSEMSWIACSSFL